MWYSMLTVPQSPLLDKWTHCSDVCDPRRYALQLTINLCGHSFTRCTVSVDLCTFTQWKAVSHSGGERSGTTCVIRVPSLNMSMHLANYNLQCDSSLRVRMCVCVWVCTGFLFIFAMRVSVFERDCSGLFMWEDSVLILPEISEILVLQ